MTQKVKTNGVILGGLFFSANMLLSGLANSRQPEAAFILWFKGRRARDLLSVVITINMLHLFSEGKAYIT